MEQPTRDDLWRLYGMSLEHYRYQHTDVWRSMQFYITINLAIIGLAMGLTRVLPTDSSASSCPLASPINLLFLLGIFVSAIAFYTLKKLREYYLRAAVHKCVTEKLLGLMEPLALDKFTDYRLALFPAYSDQDIRQIEENPEDWIKKNIFRKGVTFAFFILYGVFILVNGFGILATSIGWF